jgi:two-component sensor histidine kinase
LGEAVSNGMEHAYPAGTLDAVVDIELGLGPGRDQEPRALTARVRDQGRWRPASAKPSSRGRGLAMISELASQMRVTSNAHGTEVSFTMPLRGEQPRGEQARGEPH